MSAFDDGFECADEDAFGTLACQWRIGHREFDGIADVGAESDMTSGGGVVPTADVSLEVKTPDWEVAKGERRSLIEVNESGEWKSYRVNAITRMGGTTKLRLLAPQDGSGSF